MFLEPAMMLSHGIAELSIAILTMSDKVVRHPGGEPVLGLLDLVPAVGAQARVTAAAERIGRRIRLVHQARLLQRYLHTL